jgi:hypothetical protein
MLLFISLPGIINRLPLIVATIGIFLTLYQVKQGNKTRRATFFKELYSTMYSDPDVSQGYYLIDHGKFRYDDDFHRSEEEKPIDRLLTFIDLLCYLRKNRLIAESEIRYFEYELIRVYENKEIQRYLEVVRQSYRDFGCKTPPFSSFDWYCKNKLLRS